MIVPTAIRDAFRKLEAYRLVNDGHWPHLRRPPPGVNGLEERQHLRGTSLPAEQLGAFQPSGDHGVAERGVGEDHRHAMGDGAHIRGIDQLRRIADDFGGGSPSRR